MPSWKLKLVYSNGKYLFPFLRIEYTKLSILFSNGYLTNQMVDLKYLKRGELQSEVFITLKMLWLLCINKPKPLAGSIGTREDKVAFYVKVHYS